jgi:predicted dehydrogenase
MTDRLRAGVIGVGKMGQNHARVYRELPNVDLIGVADRDPAAARAVANEYGTRHMQTEPLLVAADLVSVAVPTPAHAAVVRDCIDAGVHVLVEKPFVTDPDVGRSLASAAVDADVTLQVGHIERFNPAVRTLTDIVPDLDVIAIDAQRLGPPVDRSMGAGVVFDLMIHDLDIATSLLGTDVASVSATGTRDGEYATATCEFGTDVVATFTASRLTQQKVRRLGITAESCRITVDYTSQSVDIHRGAVPEYVQTDGALRHRTESVVERPYVENGEPLKAELESFVAAVRTGAPPEVSPMDGIRAVELAQRIEELTAFRHRDEMTA